MDETTALQALLDGGGVVELEPRQYLHTGLVIRNDGVRLVGAGRRRTVLRHVGTGAGLLVDGAGASRRNVLVEHLELAGSASSSAGLRVNRGVACRFVNLHVTGHTNGPGIEIVGGGSNFYLVFDDVVTAGNLSGAVSVGQTIKWLSCRFQGNATAGVVDMATAPVFLGCGFEGNGGWGVDVSQNAGKNFLGCYWERNGAGHLRCIETKGLVVQGGYAAAGATPSPVGFELGRVAGSVPTGVRVSGVHFAGGYTSGGAIRLLNVPADVVEQCTADGALFTP